MKHIRILLIGALLSGTVNAQVAYDQNGYPWNQTTTVGPDAVEGECALLEQVDEVLAGHAEVVRGGLRRRFTGTWHALRRDRWRRFSAPG